MNSKIHLEILDKKRQKILEQLFELLKKEKYYLAGGTALALQIGHRQSFDFDLFKNAPVSFALKRKVIKAFGAYSLQTLIDTADELTLALDQEIKITFLSYFWDPIFPLIKSPKTIPLLGIKDIALTKAYALGRRGNYRDYFDLYAIIKNKYISLEKIIDGSKKKYGELFSERMFLEQLTYLEDLQYDEKLIFLGEKNISKKNLSRFFKKEVLGLRRHWGPR